MPVDQKELEAEILKQNANKIEKYEENGLELWVEVAAEYEVEYEIEGDKAVATDPVMTMAKHFGSGTMGIPPEYWFDKAVKDWESKTKDLDDN